MTSREHFNTAHKDSIDDKSSTQIDAILKIERPGKSVGDDRKGTKNDWEKWYEIWDVLFPGTQRPKDPCKQGHTLVFP
jgi:hypothetical protein